MTHTDHEFWEISKIAGRIRVKLTVNSVTVTNYGPKLGWCTITNRHTLDSPAGDAFVAFGLHDIEKYALATEKAGEPDTLTIWLKTNH